MSDEIPEGFTKRRGDRNPIPWNKGAILLTKAGKKEIQSPRTSDGYDSDVECRWFIAGDRDDIVAYKIVDLSEADKLISMFHEYLLFLEDWNHDPINQHALMKITLSRKQDEITSMIKAYMKAWPNDPKLERIPRINYWENEEDE